MSFNFPKQLKTAIKKTKLIYGLLYPFILIRRILFIDPLYRKYDTFIKKTVAGTVVLHLDDFYGDFEIDIRSHIVRRLFIDGVYENDIVKNSKKYISPDKDIIDIGANIGLFTVYMAKNNPGRRLLAVEPTNHAFDLLSNNVQRNGIKESVILYKGVATDKVSEAKITTISGMEEYSTIGNKVAHSLVQNEPTQTYLVPGNTIDNLVETYNLTPGFIKIDTEGAEFNVLSGSLKVLEQYRPVILTELVDEYLENFGHNSAEVVSLLKSLNYRVIDITTMSEPEFPFAGEILALPGIVDPVP